MLRDVLWKGTALEESASYKLSVLGSYCIQNAFTENVKKNLYPKSSPLPEGAT